MAAMATGTSGVGVKVSVGVVVTVGEGVMVAVGVWVGAVVGVSVGLIEGSGVCEGARVGDETSVGVADWHPTRRNHIQSSPPNRTKNWYLLSTC